jgi:hypothetical protein
MREHPKAYIPMLKDFKKGFDGTKVYKNYLMT